MTHLKRLYLKKFNFWLSHTIFISCVYRAERGERNQHRPLKWPRDGIQQHGLVLVLRRYTVRAWVVCWAAHHPPSTSTSPILWTRALSTILGFDPPQVQRPGLPRNSTMKGNNLLKQIVPVTTLRNMNMISDIFLKVFIGYLFESIRLLFFWKYSFVICLKVFVCLLFESIRLLFIWKYSFAIYLKVFVCYLFESIRLM